MRACPAVAMAAVRSGSRAFRGACGRYFSLSVGHFTSQDGEPAKFKPPPKPEIIDHSKPDARQRKFLSPEFIPPRGRTDPFKYYLERRDMVKRRKSINIPEFYAGHILSITAADPYDNGKSSTFVGICIQRKGSGLGATLESFPFKGVEMCYELYNPLIQEIKVLKLEKRLDDDLMYLRDALPEYSTVDVNMEPVILGTKEVHVNKMQVKMKPKPWSKRWEHPKFNIKGIDFDLYLTERDKERVEGWRKPWIEFDMMKEYDTSELEMKIWKEVDAELKKK
ncbi:hypothetical protein JRQ81_000145 [Phrynocephalus forsythii]|uniref:Large ribosomal subunit protein bL19m n=1 Tax=Phrynocephalus forsythii TaxID=171643 RepID=A0A9Q0Y4Q1_9SAUR|nr:hypothetical protein JRQ81_000145 [Phrynocephalus forsythii]